MSNDDSWALRELRYHTVPELKRRVRNLEEDMRAIRDALARVRDFKEAEGLAEI